MRSPSHGFARLVLGLLLCVVPVGAQESGQTPKIHTVVIKGFKFVPDQLEVTAGDTVIWKNEDIVPHTATARKVFDSKGIESGESWKYVAKEKGTHAYICTFHPTMKGQLVVK